MSELVSMLKRPRIVWLCNSAVQTSETFLVDNLEILESFAEVKAFSGNPSRGDKHHAIQHCSWDQTPQRWHHVIGKKITRIDLLTKQKKKRIVYQLKNAINNFDPDLFWIEFGTTAHLASTLLAEIKKPYIIAVHGFDITREFRDQNYKAEFTRLANNSLAIISASRHTRNLCITAGVASEKCKVIRLPLDGQTIRPTDTARCHPASFVHLGRLVEKKGPIQTLLAFEKVIRNIPEAKLTIIGDGPLLDVLKERIRHLKLEHSVRLAGSLKQNEAIQLVEKHAIFCQHSVTGMDGDQEGFALSPAEAALLEMPVISTMHNGIPEHVINGTTGILVREWDIDAMADAMMQLATHPEKARAMGKAGRQNVLNLCSPSSRKSALQTLAQSAMYM